MKTYIFITRRIIGISGTQQYIYNKMNYLESQGWRVLIFSSLQGHILVEKFRRYEGLIFPSLYLAPECYRKRTVDNTLNKILHEIGEHDRDDIIIESDALQRSLWGELIASKLKCRHLCMLVQEKQKRDPNNDSFAHFKYGRHELAGISKVSIQQLFGIDVAEVRDDAYFSASCNNVIQECVDSFSALLNMNADYTFCSIGRLDKSCVPAIIEGFRSYVADHPDKQFNIVMIGGSLIKGKEKSVRSTLGNLPNVTLVCTGNVYPIPRSFVSKIDVFVSTAGAATATYNEGLPTVKVNPLNGAPIGVIGLDFMSGEKTMYESSEKTIKDCIEEAIDKKETIVFSGLKGDAYNERMWKEYQRQLSFINYTDEKEYYPVKKLLKQRVPNYYPHYVIWTLGHLMGEKGIELFWKCFRNR